MAKWMLAALLLCSACRRDRDAAGPMERAGQGLDTAADKTGTALKGAAEKTGEALSSAGQATGKALEKAGSKLQGDDQSASPERRSPETKPAPK